MITVSGLTHTYFETGMEGVEWIVQDSKHIHHNGMGGWSVEGMNVLEEGDQLTITSQTGEELFSGTIKKDYVTGRKKTPYGTQQVAAGLWCHWIQEGFKPDDWAALFNKENHATLIKTEKKKSRWFS